MFRNFHLKSTRFQKPQYVSKAARKIHEIESLAEVQFVIDSCRFVSQSNYLNNSNKDCDWPILACFIREQCTADATFKAAAH